MLDWSDARYKLTLGFGALGMAGAMAELWKNVLSVWIILPVVMLPLVIFVFIRPIDDSGRRFTRFVRGAHVLGAAWYLACALTITIALANRPLQPAALWLLLAPLFLAGSIPCVLVLWRVMCGTYGPHE